MNTANERLIDDLAAYWTEPALEILKAAGVFTVTIEMELCDFRRASRGALQWELLRAAGTAVFHARVPEHVDGAGASQGYSVGGSESHAAMGFPRL